MNNLMKTSKDDIFKTIQKRFNTIFDDFLPVEQHSMNALTFYPQIDVTEDDKSLSIKADLPGINEKDIDITIKDNVVHIKGQKNYEKEDKKTNTYIRERSYGYFERSFSLPNNVQTDKVQASYKNGVLNIEIPKDEQKAPKKVKIDVN